MDELVNIVIAAADFAEAEGKALSHAMVRTALSIATALGACLLALAGAAVLIWAGYLGLAAVLPQSAAAAIVGAALVGIAGGTLWLARRMIR